MVARSDNERGRLGVRASSYFYYNPKQGSLLPYAFAGIQAAQVQLKLGRATS